MQIDNRSRQKHSHLRTVLAPFLNIKQTSQVLAKSQQQPEPILLISGEISETIQPLFLQLANFAPLF